MYLCTVRHRCCSICAIPNPATKGHIRLCHTKSYCDSSTIHSSTKRIIYHYYRGAPDLYASLTNTTRLIASEFKGHCRTLNISSPPSKSLSTITPEVGTAMQFLAAAAIRVSFISMYPPPRKQSMQKRCFFLRLQHTFLNTLWLVILTFLG